MSSPDPDAADNQAFDEEPEPAAAPLEEAAEALTEEADELVAAEIIIYAPEEETFIEGPRAARSAPSRGRQASRERRSGRRRSSPAAARRFVKRILLPSLLFLLGLAAGVASMLLYALWLSGEAQPLATLPAPQGSDLVIQLGPSYLAALITRQIQATDLPGQVSRVSVHLEHGAEIQIDGDDQLTTALGVTITRHITMYIQPYVSQCTLQMHVLAVTIGALSVAGLARQFEAQVNQQLANETRGFPAGFHYCALETHTEPQGLFITYAAQATARSTAVRGTSPGPLEA
jgi:hypothetical protein